MRVNDPNYILRCNACRREFDEDEYEIEIEECPKCGYSGRNECMSCNKIIIPQDYNKHPDLCGACRLKEEWLVAEEMLDEYLNKQDG